MKVTAIAPSNIAFIKYWGKKDESLRLPENASISMNLSNLYTTTTVEFDDKYDSDMVEIDGESKKGEGDRVIRHLDKVRNLSGLKFKAKVISKNNFTKGTGSSSSASGFAALSLAASRAAGLTLTEKELSILARQGSGSACRSIPDGFVEWLDGDTSETSYAVSLFPHNYWNILDVVVVVGDEKKDISSTFGQVIAATSPFFPVRLRNINDKIMLIKQLMQKKYFNKFGELLENEALELHAIMLTSSPSLIYWLPGTITIMKYVKKIRNEGLPVYFTVNTGQDIHLIIEEKNRDVLLNKLKRLDVVQKTIVNKPAGGANLIQKHLF
ncbi:MAG: Diphosphomevalonate decarboxylase [Candidatus Roizmanbacteria bacterium GW2011_GWA2_36_23]|uniref:diphosphomevalonate decarboxylase n=1 Tax=Candidatus Roizmanbacteria bacterium GW2011_GWA2_36_23 TaxID=1618480 RepID=A0A0G0GP19_9BACT|nr:MAG: Diphosphomevalonate decarboxylase [Candidatus Roizmanbacteria bacterium GW2011_GWA2_36_23]